MFAFAFIHYCKRRLFKSKVWENLVDKKILVGVFQLTLNLFFAFKNKELKFCFDKKLALDRPWWPNGHNVSNSSREGRLGPRFETDELWTGLLACLVCLLFWLR